MTVFLTRINRQIYHFEETKKHIKMKYDVFISYSRKDSIIANTIINEFDKEGCRSLKKVEWFLTLFLS